MGEAETAGVGPTALSFTRWLSSRRHRLLSQFARQEDYFVVLTHLPSIQNLAGSSPDEHPTHSSTDPVNTASSNHPRSDPGSESISGRIIAAYTYLQWRAGLFLHTHPAPHDLLLFLYDNLLQDGTIQTLSIATTTFLPPPSNILTQLLDELHHAEYGILPFSDISIIWQRFCDIIVQAILCMIPCAQRQQPSTVSPASLEAGMTAGGPASG